MKLPAGNIHSIILFRALQLGDLLCSIPAVRALRAAYPEAEITLASLPWARSLTERFPSYFNAFIHFPGYPGLPEQPVEPAVITKFLEAVQRRQYSLAIQMQGNGTIVNPLVERFGAAHTAGFCTKDDYCPDRNLFLEYPGALSEIERHLALMGHLGIEAAGLHLEFPVTPDDEADFLALQLPVNKKAYVCIHPGSRGAWRQWPPQHFAALGDVCAGRGMAVVITGTKEEVAIAETVQQLMRHKAINIAGKTSLGAVGHLIKNAFALVSNCTGVSHIASASHTPSIVISMDGEPGRWAPLNKKLHTTIDWTKHPSFDLALRATEELFSRHTP